MCIKLSKILLILSLILSGPNLFASLSYLALKGSHELIHPRFREQFSPLYGYTLLQSKELKHRRIYGNYGPKNLEYGCLEGTQIGAVLTEKSDCPQDSMSEMVQRLFPSRDGVNLDANQITIDPVSHFTPKLIGSLLNRISEEGDRPFPDRSQDERLTNDLTKLIYDELEKENRKDQARKKLNEKKKTTASQLKLEQRKCKQNENWDKCTLEKLQKDFAQLDEQIKVLKSTESRPEKDQIIEENATAVNPSDETYLKYQAVASTLVKALIESREKNNRYPLYFPEHTLMAYFLRKFNTKKEILELLGSMPKVLTDHSKATLVKHSPEQDNFLSSRFHKSESVHTLPLSQNEILDLFNDPERLVLSVEEENHQKSLLPQPLTYGKSRHSSIAREDNPLYQDCGETALRYFFNIILKDDEGNFNLKFLTEKAGVNLHPKLIGFYQRNGSDSESMNQVTIDDWSENVASGHPGIAYVRPIVAPQCELDSGSDITLNLLDQLLFYREWGGNSPITSASTPEEKFRVLCETVSRPGFVLTFHIEPVHAPDKPHEPLAHTNMKVKFKINGQDAFSWGFSSNHTLLIAEDTLKQKKRQKRGGLADPPSWSAQVSQAMVSGMEKNLSRFSLLGQWFSSSELLYSLSSSFKEQNPHLIERLIYSLPSFSPDSKLLLLEAAAEHLKNSPLRDRIIRKVIHELAVESPLPEDSLRAQRMVRVLHANGYPQEKWIELCRMNGLLKKPLVMQAAQSGDLSLLNFLLLNRFPIGEGKTSENSPMVLAARGGHLEVVKMLHLRVPELVGSEEELNQILLNAAKMQHWNVVEYFMGSVPDCLTHVGSVSQEILEQAIIWKYRPIAEKLVARIPGILTAVDQFGRTPAHLAFQYHNEELLLRFAQLAPRSFESATSGQDSVLFSLLSKGSLKTVAQLLPYFLNFKDVKDKNGKNPVQADNSCNLARIQELLKIEPEWITASQNPGPNLAHSAAMRSKIYPQFCRSLMKFIVEKYPDLLQQKNEAGDTPVHLLARIKNWELLLEVTQERRSLLQIPNDQGESPLQIAVKNNPPDHIRAELEKRAELKDVRRAW